MSTRQEEVKKTMSRRTFMGAAASTAFAFSIVPGRVLGKDAPSNKLNIGVIGASGRGGANLKGVQTENIVALCDVDMVRSKNNIRKNSGARLFRDFRVMLDKMEKDIDTDKVGHVLGLQAQLWSEYISNPQHLEYMAYPRASALAEVGWSPKASKDYNNFLTRLRNHTQRLKAMQIRYRPLD